ncbi:MAG: tetratricopeptide repeat protein [Woeseia sp.]
MTTGRQRLIATLLLGLTVLCAWFSYAPALGGAFLLDDVSNLNGLRLVEDRLSALIFVLSGDAGPVGRPLALATFVPQAAAWGKTAEPFLLVNILIHLANGCLLARVLYLLCVALRLREGQALFVVTTVPAIWLFMPLLASSSLMIIQRMTTLSAFFVLIGLSGYLQARQKIELQPSRSLVGMTLSLIAGTSLAVLAKESGVLLPLYVLVLEATVLSRPAGLILWRWQLWKAVFLLFPAAVVFAYLTWRLPYSDELVLRRGFTAWERLLTESRILWQYLFSALVPQPGVFGPFHDGYPVARTLLNPVTVLAFFGWIVTLVLAVLWRRRYPLFTFAVLWFFAGHLLESTVLPLELYFEHRNYLPVIGPLSALCILLAQVPAARRRLVYAATFGYVMINALVLFSQTSLWGNPPAAAQYWQARFPESVRAATTAAQYRLAADGPQDALQALRRLADNNPEAGYIMIPALNLSCIIAPQEDHEPAVAELKRSLKYVSFSYATGTMLSELFTTASRVGCNGVDSETVTNLAGAVLDNKRYKNDTAYNQLHHTLIARILRYKGQYVEAIQHLEQAIAHKPSADLNMLMVTTYADSQDFDAARAFIEEARQVRRWHPGKQFLWSNGLDELRRYVDELALHAKQDK